MMEGMESNSSIRDVLGAFAKSDFVRVEALLLPLSRERLVSNLELPLLLASAKTQLFKHSEARVLLAEVEPAYLSARDEVFLTRWQNGFAAVLLFEGRLEDAALLLEECASSAERHNDRRLLGYVNNTQGILFAHKGDVERSIACFNRSIAAWREVGNRKRIGFGHFNKAVLLREWGNAADAAAAYRTFEEYVGGTQTAHEEVLTSAERAMILLAVGDSRLALSVAKDTVAKAEAIGTTFLRGLAYRVLGAALSGNSQYKDAQETLRQAQLLCEQSSNKMLLAEVMEELSILALRRNELPSAEAYRDAAARLYSSMNVERHVDRLASRYLQAV